MAIFAPSTIIIQVDDAFVLFDYFMKTILPIDIVTLGNDNSYHLFVKGAIDGQKYDLLIDTGASHTIFNAALIREVPSGEMASPEVQSAGIQSGELKTSIGLIRKFKLGDLKRSDWTVVLIDLTHVNNLYKKFTNKHVAGLIGSDFLLKHQAVIDYRKRRLVFRKK